MYYTFSQNNSGGFFRGPQYAIVKANSADEANEKAESYGIYFDGVRKEIDCECCGDRWYKVYDDEGTEVPTIYSDTDLSDYDYQLYE